MRTGTRISAIGHGAAIALAVFGLPWFGPPCSVTSPISLKPLAFSAPITCITPS